MRRRLAEGAMSALGRAGIEAAALKQKASQNN